MGVFLNENATASLSRDTQQWEKCSKVQEYLDMGVPAVWILDPVKPTAYVCQGDKMTPQTSGLLRVDGTLIEVDIEKIFATSDN